jgi:hypothetical protein
VSDSPPNETEPSAPARPTRRRAVAIGLAVLGVGAALGGLAVWPRVPTPERPGVRHLDGAELALFEAFAGALMPVDGTGLAQLTQLPFVENLDRAVGRLTPALRKELKQAVGLFDLGAVVIGAHGTRFLNLTREDQAEYLDRWARGNALQRQVFGALKQVACVAYWADARSWGPLGYDGPVTARMGIPRIGNAPIPEV